MCSSRKYRIAIIVADLWLLLSIPCYTIEAVTAQSCPSGYMQQSNVGSGRPCYKVIYSTTSWLNAQQDCQSTGGRLFNVQTESDQTTLVSLINSTQINKFWIGLKKTSTDWQYVTGSQVNNFIQPQGCYLIEPSANQFNYIVGSDNNYTPATCIQSCSSRGAKYAGIVRWKLSQALECRCSNSFQPDYNLIDPCVDQCPSNSTYYCGSSRFVDAAGRTYNNSIMVFLLNKVSTTFFGWARGQPSNNFYANLQPYQACLALDCSIGSGRWSWNDQSCTETNYSVSTTMSYGHICAYPGLSQSSCDQKPGCSYAVGRCYELRWRSALTWFAARRDCIARGGDLLRFDSAELEAAIIQNNRLNQTRWWIDGVNEVWTWTNGNQLYSYTNWKSDSPSKKSYECVGVSRFDNWYWSEANCSNVNEYSYVCEADFLSSTTTTISSSARPTSTSKSTAANNGDLSSPTSSTISSSPQLTSSISWSTIDDNVTTMKNPGIQVPATPGVIIAIIFTVIVTALTTIRMFVACYCEKNSRDDVIVS